MLDIQWIPLRIYATSERRNMKKIINLLNEIFIDGLSGMASGLFATLIIGTIISQIGGLIPGTAGTFFVLIGKIASIMTGAGIGVGVATKLKASPLVVVSSATAGMIGSFASKILAGNEVILQGVGEPLGAFIAALISIYMGRLVSGRTKVDILITPFACICAGSFVGLWAGAIPYGHYCIRTDGYDSDAANQLCGIRYYPGLKRYCCGSRNSGMLL